MPWPEVPKTARQIIIMAGGLGIVPLRPLVEELLSQIPPSSIYLLYGTRSPEMILFQKLLEHWQSQGVKVLITVDHARFGWKGNVGLITDLLNGLVREGSEAVAFVCGPELMMRFSAQALERRGLLPHRIFLSLERNMKCGVGHCGHCQLGSHLLCQKGPVLPLSEVGRWLKVKEL